MELLFGTEEIPEAVLRCGDRIGELGIWYQFSRNDVVSSCPDAARRRNRLGHKGIPLWDELKSFLGEFEDPAGARRVFLAHCRGDRALDLHQVNRVIQASGEIRRATPATAERLGVQYGTVHPFIGGDVLQVFDSELRQPISVPGTVMTNAGNRTWAVEVDPAELALKSPNSRWADIVKPEREGDSTDWGVRKPETIGILTGNPCDSGLELCVAINSEIRRLLGKNSLGDVSMPRIVVVSTPEIGISMEMDRREIPLRKALLRAVDELCAAGATILAHPANTTHYFAPDMQARARENGARFISMVEATSEKLRAAGVKEITLLGTGFVTNFEQGRSAYKDAFAGLTVHRASPHGLKKVHDLGYAVQQVGPTTRCLNWMRDLLREEVPASCTHVVLAMTEFAPVRRKLKAGGRQDKILIDPMDIYAEAIACEYLGVRPSWIKDQVTSSL